MYREESDSNNNGFGKNVYSVLNYLFNHWILPIKFYSQEYYSFMLTEIIEQKVGLKIISYKQHNFFIYSYIVKNIYIKMINMFII